MKTILTLLVSLIAIYATAQDSLKTKFTLAADISPFSLNGYSFKAGTMLKKAPNVEIAAEVFSMEIPDMVINLNANNKEKGWSEKVNHGLALYIDKKLGVKRSGFWAGAGFVYLNHTAKNQSLSNDYSQLEYLARVNYKWYPFEKSGFYVNPYVALAGRHKISGDNGTYSLTPFLIIPSIYLNWEI